MQHRILLQSLLICFITICLSLSLQESNDPKSIDDDKIPSNTYAVQVRIRRATNKPGFFKTLFSVVYEQWNDTKNTIGTLNSLINDNFLPENEPVTESRMPDNNINISTTEAPYRITRTEFNKILGRNLRGLQRLFRIELQDALKQSDVNYIEYRKNASKEISRFL